MAVLLVLQAIALGAAVICGFGRWHMKRNRRSFIERWIDRFIERNPGLFNP